MGLSVALIYDLRDDYLKLGYTAEESAEFDSIVTIDALDTTLTALGYTVDRIGNIWDLVKRLAKGDRWDIAFNITEGLYGIAREAQVPALLEAYQIPYTFSPPEILTLCLDKALTKRVVSQAGVPTAPFAVVAQEADVGGITLPYPLFVKPIAEGTGKGVGERSLVKNAKELKSSCVDLLKRFRQPVLVETYLPGREFTVGILGTGDEAEAIAAMEIILKPEAESVGHTYHNKENCAALCEYPIATDAIAKQALTTALAAWRALGCKDAGRIDLRCDAAGIPQFIEANPLAGLRPEHSDLTLLASKVGVSYEKLIATIMNNACQRQGIRATSKKRKIQ